ncbi:MAG: hypothetical protein LBV41_01535 [Cytophagaceae bacterium]|jgi:hypothetical protein|nr:hypothetical protein [Cytophagaceae bacterium]
METEMGAKPYIRLINSPDKVFYYRDNKGLAEWRTIADRHFYDVNHSLKFSDAAFGLEVIAD